MGGLFFNIWTNRRCLPGHNKAGIVNGAFVLRLILTSESFLDMPDTLTYRGWTILCAGWNKSHN